MSSKKLWMDFLAKIETRELELQLADLFTWAEKYKLLLQAELHRRATGQSANPGLPKQWLDAPEVPVETLSEKADAINSIETPDLFLVHQILDRVDSCNAAQLEQEIRRLEALLEADPQNASLKMEQELCEVRLLELGTDHRPCPYCGADVPPSGKFCPSCGSQVYEDVK